MKKSINAFQVERLEDRKEFIFYCLFHKFHKTCDDTTGPGTPGEN